MTGAELGGGAEGLEGGTVGLQQHGFELRVVQGLGDALERLRLEALHVHLPEQRGGGAGEQLVDRGGEGGARDHTVHGAAIGGEAQAARGCTPPRTCAGSAPRPHPPVPGRSGEFAVFAQQGDQVGEALSGGGVGVELELELGQSAAILASSSESRAFSLLSCFIRCS